MPTKNQLKKMAHVLGVKNCSKLNKGNLIREIQKAEGHSDCFKRIADCGQNDCLFRPDCLEVKG